MPSPKSTARVDHDLFQEARVDALVDAVGRTDADYAIAGDSCGLVTAPSTPSMTNGERRVVARPSIRTFVSDHEDRHAS
jgi:hypothetical protein